MCFFTSNILTWISHSLFHTKVSNFKHVLMRYRCRVACLTILDLGRSFDFTKCRIYIPKNDNSYPMFIIKYKLGPK